MAIQPYVQPTIRSTLPLPNIHSTLSFDILHPTILCALLYSTLPYDTTLDFSLYYACRYYNQLSVLLFLPLYFSGRFALYKEPTSFKALGEMLGESLLVELLWSVSSRWKICSLCRVTQWSDKAVASLWESHC
jgi:hypothetical protein